MTAATLAVIGCGAMGRRHALAYARLRPDLRLWLVDAAPHRARRLAAEVAAAGAAAHSGRLGLALGRADAVDVCTPPGLHGPVAGRALAAGLPTLCEKPLAVRRDQEEALLEAAGRSGAPLAVLYPYRFHPAMIWAVQRVRSGALGRPVSALLRLGVRGGGSPWRHRRGPQEGGVATEVLCHLLQTAFDLLGPATGGRLLSSALLVRRRVLAGGPVRCTAADRAVLELRHRGGATSLLVADMVSPGYLQSVEVSGPRGGLWATVLPELPSVLRPAAAGGPTPGEERVEHPATDMVAAGIEAFLRSLAAGRLAPELRPQPGLARWLEAAGAGSPEG